MPEPMAEIANASESIHSLPDARAVILLLDRRPLLREALATALGTIWPKAVVTIADPDRISEEWPRCAFDVCLLAVAGGRNEGARLEDDLHRLACVLPGVPVVVLGSDDRGPDVACAVRCGARGYFPATAGLHVLMHGLQLVVLGGTALPVVTSSEGNLNRQAAGPGASVSADPWLSVRGGLLTPRELEVLRCLGQGLPNKLIAYELGVCETTVKVHLRHLFQKLGATNRTRVALLAREMLNGPDA